jgi:superfamily I DNA/RNA helicase
LDGIELARRAAAGLHAEAVGAGHNPQDPYAFVTAVAAMHGYIVEDTAPGGANLNGGRATIISGEALIVHENAGTRFDWAFLVGHEIGHLILGDASDAPTVLEVQPARPSEVAPVGFDRVVDYGRRQRREVQMDLFSRELILPRSVARELHVERGMTAADIAAWFQAPYAVVAQQLLDALLMPVAQDEPPSQRTPPKLNDLQKNASQYRGSPYLLEAGPGTGKTQTLTARIEHLLAEGVDPRRILVLTFSNKAAGEMVDRLARTNANAAAAMWMGTFHAFGLDIIRIYHAELGLPGEPRMLDRVEAAELLEQEFPRLNLRHYRNLYDPTQIIADMLAAISRAKDEIADPQRYAECAAGMMQAAGSDAERIEAAEKAAEVARVYEAYEGIKLAARCVDFGDLVMMPVTLFAKHPNIRDVVRSRYDHVLVDEFQDVNRASVRLIDALVGGGAELWAVGDTKQSIYRFRGASSYNVARFGHGDFVGGQRGRLECNYRSVDEIVSTFSGFAQFMAVVTGDASLVADRGPNGYRPQLRTFSTGSVQSAVVADGIVELRDAGYSWRDQAVLCTGNERLTEIARDLERLGIPVLFLGSIFERPEIKDLLSLISILVDRRAMGLVRTAGMPDFAMSMPDLVTALDLLAEDRVEGATMFKSIDGLSPEGAAAMSSLASALDGFDETARPWDVLTALLLDRTRIAANIALNDAVSERSKGIAIWQLMNFVAVQPPGRGLPIRRLLDRVRRLVRLSEDRDLRQMPATAQGLDAVRLMTVHGAKGLEFKVVHLPGMNSDTIPRSAQKPRCPPPDRLVEGTNEDGLTAFMQSHEQEQECLFYVAMSRARDRLLMYAATSKTNGHRRPVSKFIDRLGSLIERAAVQPVRVLPPAPDKQPIQLEVSGGLRFTAPQLALFESCARRFFYTHVLRVGGRRVTTSYMRMHEAASAVMQRIVRGPAIEGPTDVRTAIAEACRDAGLNEDPQFEQYVSIAEGLVDFFHASRAGMQVVEPVAMPIIVNGHEIIFQPDDVLIDASGIRRIRRVRTGHGRSTDTKDVGALVLSLAASNAFIDALVELVHLSDGKVTPLPAVRGDGGRAKITDILAAITAGRFEASPSPRTCPGCPAFFVCGPVPMGALRKKF